MGWDTTLKYILISFNILVMVLGLLMFFIGVAFKEEWLIVKNVLKSYMTVDPFVFIVTGTVMIVIAIFGCCGPIWGSRFMMITYIIFLLVIIIAQVISAVALFTSEASVKGRVLSIARGIFQGAPSSYALRSITDSVQEQFECCGWFGVEDYNLKAISALPNSCCRENAPWGHLFDGKCTLRFANPGCKRIFEDFYEKWKNVIVAFAIVVACMQVACIVLALYLIYPRPRKKNFLQVLCVIY